MIPNQLLAATSNPLAATDDPTKKTIVVSSLNEDQIRVLGSSVPISCRPGEEVNTFCIDSNGRSGVIALSIHTHRYGDKRDGTSLQFLLEVNGTNLNLKDPWCPPADRLGQATYFGIKVKVGDKWLTTYKNEAERNADTCYIDDGNLMCKYLAGEIKASEIIAKAWVLGDGTSTQEKLKTAELELKNAREEISSLEDAQSGFRARKETWLSAYRQVKMLKWWGFNRRKALKILNDSLGVEREVLGHLDR